MKRNIVVVESPAKAKTISQYLGSNFLVRASYGHVRDLPTKKLGIDVEHGFKPEYTVAPKAKKTISELKKDLSDAGALILATDLDREGEAIAWHLVEALKPTIPVKRITFHEITKSAVEKALQTPRQINRNLVDAQQARRLLDRLVGYKLSPFLWQKVYRGLSAGRVQSVAVRLIVEREREIKTFQPRRYWTVKADFVTDKSVFTAELINGDNRQSKEFKTLEEAATLAERIKRITASVGTIETTILRIKPQPPLITSTLQQLSARILGFSVKRTMRLAQDLYEGVEIKGLGSKALITYMRTDSRQLADSAVKQARSVIDSSFSAKYLPEKPPVYRSKTRAQEAHEAIRPTDFSLLPEQLSGKLSRDHYQLYSLIWRTAIASQMNEAQVEIKSAFINVGENTFLARGRRLIFEGFLKVNSEVVERYEDLPDLKEGQGVQLKKVEAVEHITEPPSRYSEASLIKELERRGIGRPSTYAPTLSTIVERGYVTKKAGRFYPEDVAEVVTDLLVKHFPNIVDFEFTAKMEDQLDDIAEAKDKLISVLERFYAPFAALLKEKELSIDKKKVTETPTDQKCPKCGRVMIIKLGRFGKFYACSGFPECDHTAQIINESVADAPEEVKEIKDQLDRPCPKCGRSLELKKGRYGSFIGCSDYPKCRFTEAIVIEAEAKCPNCGKLIVRRRSKRGKIFWGCSGYPKCQTAFWDEPVNKQCPKCQNLLVKKRDGLSCSQCDYKE